MPDRDGSLSVWGPDESGMKLLIAAVLSAELEEFPKNPLTGEDLADEVAAKAVRYAEYLSLFFIVTRRKLKAVRKDEKLNQFQRMANEEKLG